MTTEENRRESFRLDDAMSLQVTPLEPKRLDEITQNFEDYRLQHCLKSHFLVQRDLRLSSLNMIRKRDSDVAEYLQHLENQMLLLAERITSQHELPPSASVKTAVNLSSVGLRYHTNDELDLGQVVELGMHLSTSDTQIILLASVARKEQGKGDYAGIQEVSLQFFKIHPDDEEALIRHIVKLQQIQLQARRSA